MRSLSLQEIAHFSSNIVKNKDLEAKQADPLVQALVSLPSQLAAAMSAIPAPVISPRPQGAWIIDVSRDDAGRMSQMSAKFHEIK